MRIDAVGNKAPIALKGKTASTKISESLAAPAVLPSNLTPVPSPLGKDLLVMQRAKRASSPVRFGNESSANPPGDPSLQEAEAQRISIDKFDEELKKALRDAIKQARNLGYVTTEHFFKALFENKATAARLERALVRQKIPLNKFKELVEKSLDQYQKNSDTSADEVVDQGFASFLDALNRAIIDVEGNKETKGKIDQVELVLAAARAQKTNPIGKILGDLEKAYNALVDEEGKPTPLGAFTRDYTLAYEMGKFFPFALRHQELQHLLDILGQQKRPNAILTGKPGVGKSAILEGFAERLAKGEVPENLLMRDENGNVVKGLDGKPVGKRLLELNWYAIPQQKRQEILEAILEEASTRKDQVILFIDEIHKILSTGPGSSGNPGDQLKPYLARGDIRMIGATTLEEYERIFTKDEALNRRFAPITVEELSIEDTLTVLRSNREAFEKKHGGIQLRDDSLETAAKTARRFIKSKYLPDSALEIIDRACARRKLEMDLGSVTERLTQSKMLQLAIDTSKGLEKRIAEFQADEKSNDQLIAKAITTFDKKLSAFKADFGKYGSKISASSPFAALFNEENKGYVDHSGGSFSESLNKDNLDDVLSHVLLGSPLDFPNHPRKKELAVLLADFVKEYCTDELKQARQSFVTRQDKTYALERAQKDLDEKKQQIRNLKEKLSQDKPQPVVTPEDVLKITSEMTGIPTSKLQEDEKERLLKLEEAVSKQLIGQRIAISAVAGAIRRSLTGLRDPKRPIGSFMFLGPTGVGKTELCKVLEKELGMKLLQFNMSEFQQSHTVARLVGAPPGYVGYEEGGQLVKAVKQNPYSIVLFDEIEKAHPKLFDILLQILEEGQLTSGQGETVKFQDTIVIMSSNIGSAVIMAPFEGTEGRLDPSGKKFLNLYHDLRAIAAASLNEAISSDGTPMFRPEFLNRISDIIAFHPLMRAHNEKIAQLQVSALSKKLEATDKEIRLKLNDDALQYLVDMGTDFKNGARPIRRFVEGTIADAISEDLLAGKFKAGQTIELTKPLLEEWVKRKEQKAAEQQNNPTPPASPKTPSSEP